MSDCRRSDPVLVRTAVIKFDFWKNSYNRRFAKSGWPKTWFWYCDVPSWVRTIPFLTAEVVLELDEAMVVPHMVIH